VPDGGSRLEHLTEENPQDPRSGDGAGPMLGMGARSAVVRGPSREKDVVFICGYRADVIKQRYPEFTYVENRDWENNNILLSLFMGAANHLAGGFRLELRGHRVPRRSPSRSSSRPATTWLLGCDTDWRAGA